MDRALQQRLRNYALYLLGWTVLGLFFFTQSLVQRSASQDPTPWWHYLLTWQVGVCLCAAFTPIILWCGNRFPIERRIWVRRTALHLLFSLTFALLQLAVESILISWMGLFPTIMKGPVITFFVLLTVAFHQNIVTYWSILGMQYGVGYYQKFQERQKQALRLERDTAELRERLTQAQLGALKNQLQPHFLFNTLNAIMVLVRQQRTREAEETLGLLGDLLRCVLDDVEAQEVPLRRELHYLEIYLSIEHVRFRDRLQIEIAADPDVLDAAVPHMALQPLVENAIRHGISRSSAAGRIQIAACRAGPSLTITIRDDGPGISPGDPAAGRGIGLANTRARLQQLYGEAARLTVENDYPHGTLATMVLPYRLAPDAAGPEVMEVHADFRVDRG